MKTTKHILDNELRRKILFAIVPLVDKKEEYIATLMRLGFNSFIPYLEFLSSFCLDNERNEYLQYLHEVAKEKVGALPVAATQSGRGYGYKSPVLDQMRAARDHRNGMPYARLEEENRPLWEYEVSPCERNRKRVVMTERQAYEKREAEYLTKKTQLRHCEIAKHASNLANEFNFDIEGRYLFFGEVMQEELRGLGFNFDQDKTVDGYPVFSKPLTSHWDLAWTIRDQDDLALFRDQVIIDPVLHLRDNTLRGRLRAQVEDRYLEIRYSAVIQNFGSCYRACYSLEEVETSIKANLCLYAAMAEQLEAALVRVLEPV